MCMRGWGCAFMHMHRNKGKLPLDWRCHAASDGPGGKIILSVHNTSFSLHQLRPSKSKWLVRNNLKEIGVIFHSIFFTALRAGVITSAMEHPTMAQIRSDGYSCL